MPGLRQLEHHGGDQGRRAPAGRDSIGGPAPSHALTGRGPRGRPADLHRHRGIRPGVRRFPGRERRGPGLYGSAGRRSRHWQIHPLDAGGGQPDPAGDRAIRYRGGKRSPAKAPGPAIGRGGRHAAAGGNRPGTHPAGGGAYPARLFDHRLHPNHVLPRLPQRRRHRKPGAGGHLPFDPAGQMHWLRRVHRRPCDQGRGHRRPSAPGAYGGYGAVF